MTFTHPLALLGALLAVPVVILYLRSGRLRREAVATGMIWERVFAERPARSHWQRWRRPVSLVVQLIALALLVVALADPQIPPPRRMVVIVDNSASMQAADVKPTRLARARQAAGRLVSGLRPCDRMAVLSAGGAAGMRCNLTGDRAVLQEALRSTGPAQGSTRVDAALALARRILANHPQREIVVLSDGCFDGAAEVAAAEGVRLIRVGRRSGNLAVTRLVPRRSAVDPVKCQVLVEVGNFSDRPVDCRLELALDGRPVDTVPVRLSGDGRWQRVFQMSTAAAGRLTARLDHADAYPEDDQHAAEVPPARLHRVVLVSEGGVALRSLLEANPAVELEIAEQAPAQPAERTILVLHRRVPEVLPEGPVAVIDPVDSCDLWQLGRKLEDATVARLADDCPLLSDVGLGGLTLAGARQLQLARPWQKSARPLAWTAAGDPLLWAIDRPAGRLLVLTGRVETGTPPVTTGFPVLMTHALNWLTARDGSAEAAVETATPAAGPSRFGESDLRGPVGVGLAAAAVPARRPGPAARLYLVWAGVLWLVLEWCLYQRRWVS